MDIIRPTEQMFAIPRYWVCLIQLLEGLTAKNRSLEGEM